MGLIFSAEELPSLLLESVPVLAEKLSDELRSRLFKSLPSSRSSLSSLGFEEFNDYPDCSQHSYLEGYFHAQSGAEQSLVESIHPRLGTPLDRQPAPLPLIAFSELMRQKNQPLFDKICSSLERRTSAGKRHVLARVLREGRHLADLSVQVHWGQAVSGKSLGWHIDGPNSMLHLALGLHGDRALHSRRRLKRNLPEDNAEVQWQHPGSAYLTSPACFPHAVEFPQCDWEHRVVAVQFRLLLLPEEFYGPNIDADRNGSMANIVFQHLALGQLQVPTLEEVDQWVQLRCHPQS